MDQIQQRLGRQCTHILLGMGYGTKRRLHRGSEDSIIKT